MGSRIIGRMVVVIEVDDVGGVRVPVGAEYESVFSVEVTDEAIGDPVEDAKNQNVYLGNRVRSLPQREHS